MYAAFLALASAIFLVIALRSPRMALTILPALLPTYLLRFSVGPVPMTLLEVFLLTVVAVVFVRERGWQATPRSLFGPFLQPLLLLVAAACFATASATDLVSALGYFKAFIVEPILLLAAYRLAGFRQSDAFKAATMFGLVVFGIFAMAVFQVSTGLATPAPWDFERRATGVFDYPNALGLFAAPVATLLLVLGFWSVATLRQRQLWFALGVIALGACALSQTEAALVAIPATLFVVAFCKAKGGYTKSAIAGLAAVALALALITPPIRAKLFLQDTSGLVRRSQWRETVTMMIDDPARAIFGAGLGGYPTALAPYHDATMYEIFQYPHNIILNIWTELGLLGLLAFAWFAVTVWRIVRHQHTDPLILAAGAALLTMSIHGLVDVPFFKNDLAVLTAIVLAMILAERPPVTENKSI